MVDAKDGAGTEQGFDRRAELRILFQDRLDAAGELADALGKTMAQGGQKAADGVLRITALAHQVLARLERYPIPLRVGALHRNRAAEPGARDLRHKRGVIGVRLACAEASSRRRPGGRRSTPPQARAPATPAPASESPARKSGPDSETACPFP